LLIASALLTATGVATAEWYWRSAGYYAQVLDSRTLWAIERQRVTRSAEPVLAILGASRIQCGADLATLQRRLPKHRSVMLAINAHYPIAALRDLAQDPYFNGTVLLDLDTHALTRPMWEMQQAWVTHAAREYAPSLAFNRMLLNHWQQHMVVAQHDLSLPNLAQRWLAGSGMPFRPYSTYHADRSCDIDFSRTDPALALAQFDAHVAANRHRIDPGIPPERFLADLREVDAWIMAIQQRGGRVIAFHTPISGSRRALDDELLPRERYWDAWAAQTSAHTLHFADEPALAGFSLPDDSHLDYRDKPAYTEALVDILVRRGWLIP
jgi:hypothetical protein